MSFLLTEEDIRKTRLARKTMGQKGMRLIEENGKIVDFKFFYDEENLAIAKRKAKKKRRK